MTSVISIRRLRDEPFVTERVEMKISMLRAAALVGALIWSGSASAACPGGSVCAEDPQTVVRAMQDAGYRAKLGKMESNGNPFIESSAGGYDFEVQFDNCTDNKDCQSLMFVVSFNNDDGGNTMELANKWNNGHRFSTMGFDDRNWLNVSYDVTTVGGLSKANMASVLNWWSLVLGDVRTFFNENPVAS